MRANDFSYQELVKLVDNLSRKNVGNTFYPTGEDTLSDFRNLICLNNQFFGIIQFPVFKWHYISPNTKEILG
jgi:hypothetical protein